MKLPVLGVVVLALVLAGCSGARESRFNPRNWFGNSSSEDRLGPVAAELDNRALVATITALTIEPTSSGAVIRVEGQTPTAGWWDTELIPENNGRPVNGVLSYRFVAAAPRQPVASATNQSRTLVAAVSVSGMVLEQVSQIVVNGAQNSRSVRR